MSHFRNECKHGRLITQCRCLSRDKVIRIVPCLPSCNDNPITPLDDYQLELNHGDIMKTVDVLKVFPDNNAQEYEWPLEGIEKMRHWGQDA